METSSHHVPVSTTISVPKAHHMQKEIEWKEPNANLNMDGVLWRTQDIHKIIYEFIWLISCECFTNRNVCYLFSLLLFSSKNTTLLSVSAHQCFQRPYDGLLHAFDVRKLPSAIAWGNCCFLSESSVNAAYVFGSYNVLKSARTKE